MKPERQATTKGDRAAALVCVMVILAVAGCGAGEGLPTGPAPPYADDHAPFSGSAAGDLSE